jgi:hypothetical protein
MLQRVGIERIEFDRVARQCDAAPRVACGMCLYGLLE